MDELSLLIVSNLLTLVIALLSVWLAQYLANKKSFKNAKSGILSEIELNVGISTALLEFIRVDEKRDNEPFHLLVPFPRYRTTVFDSIIVGGFTSDFGGPFMNKLTEAYMAMLEVNDSATRHENLTFGVEAVMSNTNLIRKSNLALAEGIVKEQIQPALRDLKNMKLE